MLRRFGLTAAVATAATLALAGPQAARAITVVPPGTPFAPIIGTGQDMAPGTIDPVWKVVALPASYVPPTPPPPPSTFNAFVYQRTFPVYTGGGTPQTGVNTAGIQNYWVGPNAEFGDVGAGFWILSQDFTVPKTRDYLIRFKGMVDDRAWVYLGGTVDSTTDPNFPNINGGIPLGTLTSYETFSNFDTLMTLNAGTQTINIVVANDLGPSAVLIAPLYVPGPLPVLGAAVAFGASRRVKRRIQLASAA
ncbi:MAG: hypothetical protein ACKOZW_05090 [Cyanobium sp.]